MIVTLQRWKYNNDEMKITKKSTLHSIEVEEKTALDCMNEIKAIRENSNLARFTPWEIINIQD